MAIDYSDKNQTTHGGEPIPIDTAAKYSAGEAVIKALYGFYGVPYDADAAATYESRVRQGMAFPEIVSATFDDFVNRFNIPIARPK